MSKFEYKTRDQSSEQNIEQSSYIQKAQYIKTEDYEKCENIQEEIDLYQKEKNSDEIINLWKEKCQNNTANFFSEENIKWLETISQAKRLSLLSHLGASITTTPELTELIFEKFPEDLVAINYLFKDERGHASDTNNFYLYSLSAPSLAKFDNSIRERFEGFAQYEEIAKRRSRANKLIMDNYNSAGLEYFKEFNKDLQKDLFNILEEADEAARTGDHIINPDKLFTKNYEKLSPEEKTSFLRKCLATLHYSLLFEETFNSAFTEKLVRDSEQRRKEPSQFNEAYNKKNYDVAHSMIFNTYQPFATYNFDQNYYNRKMGSTAETGGGIEEYGYHKIIIAVLEKLKNSPNQQKENIETILDFWSKNKNPIFANAVTDALSLQDPEYTAGLAMNKIRNEKGDKRYLTALLYRLELGRMNISKEGAQYLERMYDLGEYNNENGHIERLTNEGEIGIFNEEQELIKYFHLGDLSSPEKKVRAKIFDITYETLFIERPSETEAEKLERLHYVDEFKKNYHDIAKENIFEESGVRLNNLEFKEQGWFLIYFNKASEIERDRLRNFVTEYGEEGIKTFLSLEEDSENGAQNILFLSENLKSEVAQAIYTKFNEVSRLAKETDAVLAKSLLTTNSKTDVNLGLIKRQLLKNSVAIIQKLTASVQTDINNPKLAQTIFKELENSKTEIITLASTLQAAKKDGATIELSDLTGLSLQIKGYEKDFSNDEKQEIFSLAQANWQSFGNNEMARAVLDDFKSSLKDTRAQRYYILRFENDIIGFVRFQPTDHETTFAGSFNVSRDLRGLNIGNRLMENALAKEGELDVLEASASIKIPAGCAYVEKVGFVADGLIENYHQSGEMLFSIKLNADKNSSYASRVEGKTTENIIRPETFINEAIAAEDIKELPDTPRVTIKCNLTKNFEAYQKVLSTLLPKVDDDLQTLEPNNGKYTMTRYWQDKSATDDIRYLVFEKNKIVEQKLAA